MDFSKRSKFAVLLMLQALWGLVLWFSISKYGVGISTDSIHMLFGGLNWWAGRGLTSYDGSFLILWPPLYPLTLGLVHGLSGLSMLGSANLVQATAYAGVSICLALLSLRIFPNRFALAAAACVLSDAGVVVLTTFDTAGSDYLQLFLILLLVLLTGRHIEGGSRRAYVGIATVTMLAMLNRYLGVAALAAAIICLTTLTLGSLRTRLTNSLVLGTTVLPTAVWFSITSRLYSRRPPISFGENFTRFSQSILQWFVGPTDLRHQLDWAIPALWISIAGLIVVMAVFHKRESGGEGASSKPAHGQAPRNAYLWPLLIFGVTYVVVLFAAASVAYSNKLAGRFLLPAYVPLIMLPVIAAGGALHAVGRTRSNAAQVVVSVGCYGALIAMASMLLNTTMPVVLVSHAKGASGGENAYNNAAWRENRALNYWLEHTPAGEFTLMSNQPDGVAFLTQHLTEASPRRTSGPYGTEEYGLDSYKASLFGSQQPIYLVWIDPKACPYCYSVDELQAIARIEPLMEGADGGVYRLEPR